MDPAKYEYQSEFARRYFAEGKVEGKAELVLKLLSAAALMGLTGGWLTR